MQNPTSPESKITQLLKEKEGVYISGQADFAKMTLHKHKTLTIWITYVFSVSDYMNSEKSNETFFTTTFILLNDNILKDCTHFISVLCTFYSRNGGSETQTLLSYRSYNQVNECQFTIEPRSDADTTEIVIEAGSVLPVVILCKARCVIIREK